ncbi:hypothetical protein DFH27DRAFT_137348 [Peziza echinospora]|nr:hypothetical protein DFH27DRAFT_137348 [Peziza echinospora]
MFMSPGRRQLQSQRWAERARHVKLSLHFTQRGPLYRHLSLAWPALPTHTPPHRRVCIHVYAHGCIPWDEKKKKKAFVVPGNGLWWGKPIPHAQPAPAAGWRENRSICLAHRRHQKCLVSGGRKPRYLSVFSGETDLQRSPTVTDALLEYPAGCRASPQTPSVSRSPLLLSDCSGAARSPPLCLCWWSRPWAAIGPAGGPGRFCHSERDT